MGSTTTNLLKEERKAMEIGGLLLGGQKCGNKVCEKEVDQKNTSDLKVYAMRSPAVGIEIQLAMWQGSLDSTLILFKTVEILSI